MKKCSLLFFLLSLGLLTSCVKQDVSNSNSVRYTLHCTVVSASDDEVVAEDESGHVWAALFDGSEYEEGEPIVFVMDDNATPDNITDDSILGVLMGCENEL